MFYFLLFIIGFLKESTVCNWPKNVTKPSSRLTKTGNRVHKFERLIESWKQNWKLNWKAPQVGAVGTCQYWMYVYVTFRSRCFVTKYRCRVRYFVTKYLYEVQVQVRRGSSTAAGTKMWESKAGLENWSRVLFYRGSLIWVSLARTEVKYGAKVNSVAIC